ncbi:MAG: hypothetical protein WCS94_06925 [Verrucomicrobiota bacterium]
MQFQFCIRVFMAFLGIVVATAAQADQCMVSVATKPGSEWKKYATRILTDLPAVAAGPADFRLSRYGGWLDRREKATGFFHTARIDGRWWLVDPDGYLFLNAGVASVKTIPTAGAESALAEKFKDKSGWAEATARLLRTNGFNGTGGWSEDNLLSRVQQPVASTRLLGFMAGFGKTHGGTHMQPGHLGYPHDCIFVFDPAFEKFCDDYARPLAANKNDPWLLGYFSDNELPFSRHALTNYLALPADDPGHEAALKFLQSRHGAQAAVQAIGGSDEADFLAVVASRYFGTVARAIKKYDPNHLYLGSRFYAVDSAKPELFRACGPFVDVVSMNYYRAWTPDAATMQMWAREAGRPILITEWYAKAEDSGMPNTGGAGWLVKTQRERGLFYQNYALALLESKVCVGWHWFRYADNDPADKAVDPSNRDSNKGIVNNRYDLYSPLLAAMQPLNRRLYSIVNYFDRASGQPVGQRTPGEKGD